MLLNLAVVLGLCVAEALVSWVANGDTANAGLLKGEVVKVPDSERETTMKELNYNISVWCGVYRQTHT